MAQEKIFASGFIFKQNEAAPDFVIGSLSIKLEDAIPFLKHYDKDGWVSLDVKIAKKGNIYVELNTFEPKSTQKSVDNSQEKPNSTHESQQRGTDGAAATNPPVNEEDDLPF